jgi:hypothetical protein
MTTADGSALAMGGISMMPAPTRLRRVLRLLVVRGPLVSRETSTRPDVRPVTGAGRAPPVPGAAADPAAAVRTDAPAAGAMPHVSQ